MRPNMRKTTFCAALLAATSIVTLSQPSFAQTVSLTASKQSTTLPDGNSVPMWGWTCGDSLVTPVPSVGASCTSLTYINTAGVVTTTKQLGGTVWQPPLIVVPYNSSGTSLTITLTNALPVNTSLMIVGQPAASGGAIGTPVRESGPRTDGDHQTQTGTTWPTVGQAAAGTAITGFTPPTQGARVRSFVTEVAGVATFGTAPQSLTYSWNNLQPGTYLLRTGTYPSIQGPMGLYGVVVVTQPPGSVSGSTSGIAYPGAGSSAGAVIYDADVVALESEIDARQNDMVAALFPATGAAGSPTANAGFSETTKWTPQCGAAPNSSQTTFGTTPSCYPPAVDYTPLYFLFNGVAFNKENQQASALAVPAPGATGNVLVRFVNAGSHMHIPSVNNLSELLVAEDANVLPDIALALGRGKTLSARAANAPATAAAGLQLRNEVWMAAGKVMDVIVSPAQNKTPGSYDTASYMIYDHSLSGLSTNNLRDGGMQVMLDVNDVGGAALAGTNSTVSANPDSYQYAPGVTLTISDPGKGVIANDLNVYGVQITTAATSGTVNLNPDGTFAYVPSGSGPDSFGYCANGAAPGTSGMCTTVSLSVSPTVGQKPTANPDLYTAPVASMLRVAAPGVLGNDVDSNGYPLTAVYISAAQAGLTVHLNADGSFTATKASSYACPLLGCTFTYQAQNSEGALSAPATVTVNFLTASNLVVNVQDTATQAPITDYKWIIEKDITFHIDPACQQNGPGGTKPTTCPAGIPPTLGTNFHASFMPVVATGCTGPQSCGRGQTVFDNNPKSPTYQQHIQAACDGYGICTPGATQNAVSMPGDVNLPATDTSGIQCTGTNTPAGCNANYGKPIYYYISVLPGDSANPFNYGNASDPTVAGNCAPATGQTEATGFTTNSTCGHTMGGAPIAPVCTSGTSCTLPGSVTVNAEANPLHTATVTVFVFEDDYPTNGEPDTGGGVDTYPTEEAGLEDFQVVVWDLAGCVSCDNTGQDTYDQFNVPLTNALNGTPDPTTGLNACPISNTQPGVGAGVIIVCPKYESDGKTLSPLVGQAVIKNLNPGLFDVTVHPGAARESRGEEWLQTNTLDGSPKLDAFVKAAEPGYFQEFGPGGYHVFFGEANPAIINSRLHNPSGTGLCDGTSAPPCKNTIHGQVTNLHQGRSPDERLWTSGVFPQGNPQNSAAFSYTTCWATIGDTDGLTFQLAKCDANGNFTFTNIPDGDWGVTVFDQWNDLLVDGSSRSVTVKGGQTLNMEYGSFSWQSHLWSKTYLDTQGLGTPVLDAAGNLDPVKSPPLIQVPTRVRMRNGKINNTLLSDIGGNAHFDETFPLFNWYVVESDTTRFRGTGVHVVNDAGGQLDGPANTSCLSYPLSKVCGNGNVGTATDPNPYQAILNSTEIFSLPGDLQTPGAVYCAKGDPICSNTNYGTAPAGNAGSAGNCNTTPAGTGTIGGVTCSGLSTGRIDPGSTLSEGWQGGVSEYEMTDWGKLPYAVGETGGIRGHVVNATTRPFDDPGMVNQNLWEPLVPRVTINLYQESTAPDGTTSLTLVDTTTTSSWDDYVSGFDASGRPNINCPGEDFNDPYFSYTMAGTTNFLNPGTPIPHNSQFKCFDGFHNLSQLQPAPYDGMYQFPSPYCAANPGGTFTAAGRSIQCVTVKNPALSLPVHTGAAPAVLPTGKYVTEVVLPPGWEINKEEDLNLLIGDNFIAPVSSQFGGIANIFITPDQASIDAMNTSYTGPYTAANPYNQPFNCAPNGGPCTFTANTTNNGKETTDLGRGANSGFSPGGIIKQAAPCVGLMRVVPDYLSISPESGEVAPFAGAVRPLCDRKEVTITDQMQTNADFFVWTQVPAAAHYTGFISDDFASEFDPANPAFGEKFAVVNVPIGIKDYNGVEISRVYADQWGTFNGLAYSTWQVNPPNITGYGPNVMIFCMNDPGPIKDLDPSSPTYGQMITDPHYNPNYSDFCYEWSLMPGDTAYLDTPVVPTSAFAEGYNPPDCAYPDATPAIKEVDGDGIGPWVSASGSRTLTITALGDQQVQNDAYSGPAANTPPYNLKTIKRHYGFGSQSSGTQCTAGQSCVALLGADGKSYPLTGVSWTDTAITGTVPANLPLCSASNPTYRAGGNSNPNANARCGELVITAANGKQSIDAVTVTLGGTTPKRVAAGQTIQSVIDAATPGDLIIVPAGHYHEMLLMWKPVRLQGVAAASTIVDANTNPAGQLLEPWRREVDCLFGLSLNGALLSAGNPYDPTGTYSCNFNHQANTYQVDPIPLEPIIGWVASLNGNIAELLQEPTLMGAYEGAAITVLGRGWEQRVLVPTGGTGTNNASSTFTGTLLTSSTRDCRYASNYLCNPSRVDGMSFMNSSQGGGGIFLHGWNHYTEVANNRVYNNGGTLSGGIVVGQTETPDGTIAADGTTELPFLLNEHVNIHHNSITANTAYGDELNSNTPAAAGGVSLCNGSDYYKFNYNWVCGNLSMGDGGGIAHFGFSYNGDIEHNSIIFNQSTNPTLTTYGGGLIAEGVGPDGTLCENSATVDLDCPPQLPDGIGPGLVINANLIQGNTAEGGSGGGLRLQKVNGTDVQRSPLDPSKWYQVTVTNNIFVNNVAGWGGGGVSLVDSLLVNFVNNTVASNDSTATAGVLFDSPTAPNANVPPPNCDPTQPNGVPLPNGKLNNCSNTSVTISAPMVAGLQADLNSLQLQGVMNPKVHCPTTHPNCYNLSNPQLENDLFWQNRAFNITTGVIPAPGLATAVQLVPALQQLTTGACPAGTPGSKPSSTPNYWDIGVYGDTSATSHDSKYTLNPRYSLFSSGSYSGSGTGNISPPSPGVIAQYCNGSRVPPEIAPTLCSGPNGNGNAQGCVQPGTVGISLTVPPGITDSTYAGPAFSLTPAATVDEGSNWVNMFYGPLSLSNPTIAGGTSYGGGAPLGNYAITTGSPAIDAGTGSGAPSTDFYGNTRPQGGGYDIGAVEYVAPAVAVLSVTGGPVSFGNQAVGYPSAAQTLTLHNTGTSGATGIAVTFSSTPNGTSGSVFTRPNGAAGGTCGTALAAGNTCTINVAFTPTSTRSYTGAATIAASVVVSGSPVALSGTGVAAVISASLMPPTWNASCTGALGCGLFAPLRTFTLSNTGNAPLQNITQGTLSGTNANQWTIVGMLSSCGPAGGGQLLGNPSLNPGATCTVTVRFTPTTTGAKGPANLSIVDAAGTQTSTLTGTRN